MPEKYFGPSRERETARPQEADSPDEAGIEAAQESLVPRGPRLAYMREMFKTLRQPEGDVRWMDLNQRVEEKPNRTMLELSDNIREVVRDYIAEKIPALRSNIAAIGELSGEALLDALTHNWFEGVDEQVEGQRRQVLLTVGAHIVKRIETAVYKQVLASAKIQLENFGLDESTRDLLVDVLDVSLKSDPLFIRFLAFVQKSKKPPPEASQTALFVPGDKNPHTIAELFPHETHYMAKRFASMAEHSDAWIGQPGGTEFKHYLEALALFYKETDAAKAKALQKTIEDLYTKLAVSDFPIVLTTGFEGSQKPPYLDPEMRVSIKSRETEDEQRNFERLRDAMAESLEEIGMEQFSGRLKEQPIRIVNVVGNYGINLTMSAVAQEDPTILFLNEQIRQYDRDFPGVMQAMIRNTDQAFASIPPEQRTRLMEKMSRTVSVLHEYCHAFYWEDKPEYPDEYAKTKRLGVEELETISDVKAEIAFRSLIPACIAKGALEGTKEQWACGMLAESIQMLKDRPEDDDYYLAAVYSLNRLFQEGAVVFRNHQLEILDYDAYYRIQRTATQEVLALYEDVGMNAKKSAAWIQKKCKPSKDVAALSRFLKKRRSSVPEEDGNASPQLA